MPYTKADGTRDYKRQGALVDSKPEAIKHRAENVQQNRDLAKRGIGSKGDGMDAGHIRSFKSGGTGSRANTRLVSESKNRSKK
jgi:hypothetical protein